MLSIHRFVRLLPAMAVLLLAWGAVAQSFRVQCPRGTATHPPINGAPNPGIKCQQISGGDGFATMGDGTQTYLFGFGPLSGLRDIFNGLPGTQTSDVFNLTLQNSAPALYTSFLSGSGPSSLIGAPYNGFTYNGAIGLVPDPESDPTPGQVTGHVDPRMIMDVGVMNANQPAPLFAIDEDDEFFLTLTNVGQIMRPDLFEQHTVHFHGYPNASSFYDGVPDASIAINVGGSFTYYYLAPEAGTYFWHCHISPPEHLQMGMVGQIYVRPRQNRVNGDLRPALMTANIANARPAGNTDGWTGETCNDILCSGQTPLPPTSAINDGTRKYAYNDGDGSTAYDVEYPLQMMGFDPNFHFVGMTFNPESFTDMKDKFFMLNGRSYPDTISQGAMQTQSTDGTLHSSQPLPSIINIPVGGRALLRISDLSVTEHSTLASLGIPMKVIAINARLLRDMAGNDMTYYTNSITLGGGESLDVILDASDPKYLPGSTYYLYTPNLDHLSNDAENFGGMMTEVNICSGTVNPTTKACN